jgi:transposase InsO family protein
MAKLGIKSIVIKKFWPATNKSKTESKENVLNRDFSANTINEKWVTDITCIYTIKYGWCNLASVMDLYRRKIIGHAMSKAIDTKLALQAVKNAMLLQKPKNPLILHSNLGRQYTSQEFARYISESKTLIHFFSTKGCPYDNACTVSFRTSLKKETVNRVKYYDFDSARLSILNILSPGTTETESVAA